MTIETYLITVKHDIGSIVIQVVSLTGEQGAIHQVLRFEACPESAIVKSQKIKTVKVL